MKNTYRAVIVGLGNIAWRFDAKIGSKKNFLTHAYSYINNEKTTLVGGCSPNSDDRRLFEKIFDIPTFDSINSLIDSTHPDIISICSPSEFHYKQVLYCIEHNIPMIWLEKPPASSLMEIDYLLEKSIDLSKIMVNYQRRYIEIYKKFKNIYSDGKLGKCRLIELHYSRGLELNGSHIIDVLFFIIGCNINYRLEWVSSFGDYSSPCFAIKLENGVGVMVSGIALSYHCVDISMTCEFGRASILHGGMTAMIEKKVEHELFPGFYRLKTSKSDYFASDCVNNSMEQALNNLINSYEKNEILQSSLESARNTSMLIEQIRKKQKNL